MKRTPVLIDVNGVPLRESLSYNGAVQDLAGKWLSGCHSAQCRCGPAARVAVWGMPADDLVRNNGIAG